MHILHSLDVNIVREKTNWRLKGYIGECKYEFFQNKLG